MSRRKGPPSGRQSLGGGPSSSPAGETQRAPEEHAESSTRRTERLELRLTPDEREAIATTARLLGLTVSEHVRERLSTPCQVTAREVAAWLRAAQYDDTSGDEAAALGAAAAVVGGYED